MVRMKRIFNGSSTLRGMMCVAFCLIAPSVFAQSLANAVFEDSAKLAVSSDSRIGPDDLLNITVFEAPEMNTSVRVSTGGDISLQLLGSIHAAGLTASELETVLQGLLRRTYMKDPHVGVFVQELQSHPVTVLGAVKAPGVFQIRGTKTLLDVLSMAQGLTEDAGDTVFITHDARQMNPGNSDEPDPMLRNASEVPRTRSLPVKKSDNPFQAQDRNSKIQNVNLKNLLESPDPAFNVQIRPGDVIRVSRAGIVYVVGEVNKPGGFVLLNNESISVLQAIALAQGTTHTSAISQARIIRMDPVSGKQIEIPMNLGKIFSGKRPDAMLQPKDIVFVPNSAAKSVMYRGSAAAIQTAAGVAIYKW